MKSEVVYLSAPANSAHDDQNVGNRLKGSAIFRDYQKAFQTATGLPLEIRPVGTLYAPLQGSKRANPFCSLMAGQNKTCSACLQLQRRIEDKAIKESTTLECFAGLSESCVPVRVGDRVVAYLQTGQVLLRRPTPALFKKLIRGMADMDSKVEIGTIKQAFFRTRFVARKQYESFLRLLSIFSEQLSSVSNQILLSEAAAELPTVARARSYIAEHQSEEISLLEVARAVNMSVFYFCKTFRKSTGLTFTEYLARVRVETVKQLLINPHKRVSEAAFEAGFQSLSQFNRVFRRIAGEAPSNYRIKLHGLSGGLVGGSASVNYAA